MGRKRQRGEEIKKTKEAFKQKTIETRRWVCRGGGGGEPEDEMKRKQGGDNGTEGERLVQADLAKRGCLDMEIHCGSMNV